MIESIFISYSIFIFLYFIFLIRELSDCNSVIDSSKSRDLKNLAKSKIIRTRSDIALCAVWPYLLYKDVSLAIKALKSLK